MSSLNIRKVLELPVVLEPNAVYLIKNDSNTFSLQATDSAGNIALSQIAEVDAIDSSVISDATSIGRSVLTAENASDIRTLLNAFDSDNYKEPVEFFEVVYFASTNQGATAVVIGDPVPDNATIVWEKDQLVYSLVGPHQGKIYQVQEDGTKILFRDVIEDIFFRVAVCPNNGCVFSKKENGVFTATNFGWVTSTKLFHYNSQSQKVPVSEFLDLLSSNIGDLDSLNTATKTSTVSAISEVKTAVTAAQSKADEVGILTALTTTAKGNVVVAVNEVKSTADDAQAKANTIGLLASLTTTVKTSIVNAINEVKAATNSLLTSIGTLASLTTTAKTDLVSAINEVRTTALQPATSATKLATARSINVNLASTVADDFDGTSDASVGVTGILPVANGGTGGNTITTARTALGVSPAENGAHTGTTSVQTLQVNNIFENPVDMVTGNVVVITAGSFFIKTIAAASTLSVSGVISGRVNSFVLELTNGGNYTVTWWSGIKWEGGVPPQLTANGVDLLTFMTRDNGVTWRGSLNSKDSK